MNPSSPVPKSRGAEPFRSSCSALPLPSPACAPAPTAQQIVQAAGEAPGPPSGCSAPYGCTEARLHLSHPGVQRRDPPAARSLPPGASPGGLSASSPLSTFTPSPADLPRLWFVTIPQAVTSRGFQLPVSQNFLPFSSPLHPSRERLALAHCRGLSKSATLGR